MKQGMSNRQHITDIPISVIAQQLGVRYLLGGSVRALGGQIRLAAQLAES
jgi:TolB-like protein